MTGIESFLEILASAGLTHLFGNPGTTELPLNDALVRDRRFQYLFGVQEIPVVAMADGYTMASGKVGVVNVHIAPGLGNAMGMLYNAYREGTPLLVTAGQQDRRLRLGEPVLDADLVRVAQPWTKWAYEVNRVEDIPTATRRAIQTALAPPTGPVFLSLPLDLQMESAPALDLSAPTVLDNRVRPPLEALQRAAEMMARSQRPAILAGSRVMEAGASQELVRLAERLGAPVFAEGTATHGRLPMPTHHPLYRSVLPYWGPDIQQTLEEFDLLLTVGTPLFRLYIHREPARSLPQYIRIIHLDNHPWEIGKNFPTDVGLLGDPRSGLAELDEIVADLQTDRERQLANERTERWAGIKVRQQDNLRKAIEASASQRPLAPLSFMNALGRVLPENVAVVEEAITSHHNVFERLGLLRDPAGFFAHRGWALGWGMGCALGVQVAWPDRPVLGLIGDGSALYGIQALWSAAHHQIPVTFVIANNRRYKILEVCGDVLNLPGLTDPACPGMTLDRPPVDFVKLAESFGVAAMRIEEADALSDAVRASFQAKRPCLIEVPVAAE